MISNRDEVRGVLHFFNSLDVFPTLQVSNDCRSTNHIFSYKFPFLGCWSLSVTIRERLGHRMYCIDLGKTHLSLVSLKLGNINWTFRQQSSMCVLRSLFLFRASCALPIGPGLWGPVRVKFTRIIYRDADKIYNQFKIAIDLILRKYRLIWWSWELQLSAPWLRSKLPSPTFTSLVFKRKNMNKTTQKYIPWLYWLREV